MQFLLRYLDALGQHTLVQLNLFFARATHTDTTLLPIQVGPASHQARLRMLELSEFNLELAFVAAGAFGKNGQNQLGSSDDPAVQGLLQVSLLPGR